MKQLILAQALTMSDSTMPDNRILQRVLAIYDNHVVQAFEEKTVDEYLNCDTLAKKIVYRASVDGYGFSHRDAYMIWKELIDEFNPDFASNPYGIRKEDPWDNSLLTAQDEDWYTKMKSVCKQYGTPYDHMINIVYGLEKDWDQYIILDYDPFDSWDYGSYLMLHKDFVYSGRADMTIKKAIKIAKENRYNVYFYNEGANKYWLYTTNFDKKSAYHNFLNLPTTSCGEMFGFIENQGKCVYAKGNGELQRFGQWLLDHIECSGNLHENRF